MWDRDRRGIWLIVIQSEITAVSSTTMDAPVLLMPAPLCLVTNKDGELSLNATALEVLRCITHVLVVVASVVLNRTGKSFLMNRLARKRTGFPLGAMVHAETKGIWMWSLPHPWYHGELVLKLKVAKEEFCRRNEEASEQRCRTVLQELWRDVELCLENGDYVAPGGAQLFKEDLNRMLEEYKQRHDKGVRAEAVLEVFLREREGLEQVLKATEVQMELAGQQREAAVAGAEAVLKAAEVQLEEQQRILEHHRKEYEALVREGFKHEAAAMQAQISELQKEKKKMELGTLIKLSSECSEQHCSTISVWYGRQTFQ